MALTGRAQTYRKFLAGHTPAASLAEPRLLELARLLRVREGVALRGLAGRRPWPSAGGMGTGLLLAALAWERDILFGPFSFLLNSGFSVLLTLR